MLHGQLHGQLETCLNMIEQDGLLPFLGQAICWSQCPDIADGFLCRSGKIPFDAIIPAVHSISDFLSQESQNFGIPVSEACKMLKTIGAVTIVAKDSELPVAAIVGMIRLYGIFCHDRDMFTIQVGNELADIISSLLWGGCVDETVMKEVAKLHDTCPVFVARCTVPIFSLGDSCVAEALRSGLLANTLSICAELGRQDIRISTPRWGPLGDDYYDYENDDDNTEDLEDEVGADALASGIIDQLYRRRLHNKTHKVLALMSPLNFWGMEDKLEQIFRNANESVCANCLRSFDRDALKWCKGTHMLEPFCSKGCLKESWDAGACADFSDVVQEDDDKRLISLKRNILQAGSKVLQESIGRIMNEHIERMSRGQGLTIAINLREFPHRVSSGLLPPGDPSDRVQVRFIADDFRDYVNGKVLVLRKQFPIRWNIGLEQLFSGSIEYYEEDYHERSVPQDAGVFQNLAYV